MTLSWYNDFAPARARARARARNAHPLESPKSFHRFRNPQISRDRQYRRRLDPGEDKRGRARQTRGAGGRGGVRQKLQVQRDTSRDLNVERATGVKSSNLQETIFVIHCGRGSIRSLPPVMNLSGLRQRRTQLLHPLAKNLYSAQENRFLINPAFGRV